MAKIIKADGQEIVVRPENKIDFQLTELQPIVGGYIEIVNVKDDCLMVVNEEGRLIGLPFNVRATEIAGQVIVGDVLVCKKGEIL